VFHHAALSVCNRQIVAVALWATRTFPTGKRLQCLRDLFHHAALCLYLIRNGGNGISDIEGKAAQGSSERVRRTSDFQVRRQVEAVKLEAVESRVMRFIMLLFLSATGRL